MRKQLECSEEWLKRPEVIKMMLSDLVKTLLEAVIKNAEAGIHNGVLDRNLDYVDDQYLNLERGLELLDEFEGGYCKDSFDYGEVGELLIDSTDDDSIEKAIYTMLDYYESVTKTECKFDEDDVKMLLDEINNG